MERRNRKRKGFTLIEMLVVIIIIVLLLTILVPGLLRVLDYARMVVCNNNINSIFECYTVYARAYDGAVPRLTYAPFTMSGGGRGGRGRGGGRGGGGGTLTPDERDLDQDEWVSWVDSLQQYGLDGKNGRSKDGKDVPMCPKYIPEKGTSYCQNQYIGVYIDARNRRFDGELPGDENVRGLTEMGHLPDEVPLLTEGPDIKFGDTLGYVTDIYNHWNDDLKDGTLGQRIDSSASWNNTANNNSPTPHLAEGTDLVDDEQCWYYGRASVLYCDGHSESVLWDENDFARVVNGDQNHSESYNYIRPDGTWARE